METKKSSSKGRFKKEFDDRLFSLYGSLAMYFNGECVPEYILPFLFRAASSFWCRGRKEYLKKM